MLYLLFDWLEKNYDILGISVFQYISFRASLSIIFALLIALFIGKKIIRFLQKKQIGETIRELGPESHHSKKGTPTMGGIIILFSILVPTILWGDLTNAYLWLIIISTIWMGLIGFLDDYIKVFKKNKQGLKGKFKVVGQVGLGLIVGFTMILHKDFKGPKRLLGENNELKVTEFLQNYGFQKGDILVSCDGKTVKQINEIKNFANYTVKRKNSDSTSLIKIFIPIRDRKMLSRRIFLKQDDNFALKTNVPFFKNYEFDYANLAFWEESPGWASKAIYILMTIFIVTAVSNGVNITDGLDGLAAGTTAVVGVSFAIFAYVAGNVIYSDYLEVSYVPNSAELVIFTAALIGASVGFLWYNAHPAQVFMGDTGSLALGGVIGVLALMIKKEFLVPVLCGIFFIESLSVIIQVTYFKYTKRKYGEGKRVFKMAPIHHHFEKLGFHESKIVTRFWIIAIILAIVTFVTLKLR